MEYKVPKAEDISYYYNAKGYMMTYKGRPIGGAGIDRTARGCRSNLKLFKQAAETTKSELARGGGSEYMKACIMEIDRAEEGHNAD